MSFSLIAFLPLGLAKVPCHLGMGRGPNWLSGLQTDVTLYNFSDSKLLLFPVLVESCKIRWLCAKAFPEMGCTALLSVLLGLIAPIHLFKVHPLRDALLYSSTFHDLFCQWLEDGLLSLSTWVASIFSFQSRDQLLLTSRDFVMS